MNVFIYEKNQQGWGKTLKSDRDNKKKKERETKLHFISKNSMTRVNRGAEKESDLSNFSTQ